MMISNSTSRSSRWGDAPQRAVGRWVLSLAAMLILSCTCGQLLPLPGPATEEPGIWTERPTLAATEPLPPPGLVPEPTVSSWEEAAGTWSGCLGSVPDTGPAMVEPCEEAFGMFITLYLQPDCGVGEACGSYVKAVFESEFILFRLTLQQIDGPVVKMFAEAMWDEFSWADTEVDLEPTGAGLLVTEASGEAYLIPPGCDPLIMGSATIGCSESVP